MRLFALILLLANLTTLTWVKNFSTSANSQYDRQRTSDADLGVGLEIAVDPNAIELAADQAEIISDELENTDGVIGDIDTSPPQTNALESNDEELVTALVSTETAPLECVELGPFSNEDLASMAAVRLRDIGYQATLRESGGQIRSGFWVYLPPYQNRQDAEQAVADLKERGISDLFVVTGSEQLNAVSLGLYSNGNLADQRAASIGKIGYTPRIAEHFRDATVFWIEYRENADNPLTPEDVGVFANALELPEKNAIVCGSG